MVLSREEAALSSPWVALESTTDRRALARRLARSRDEVLAGERPRGLREVIVGSWRRSTAAGVDADAALAPVTVGEAEASERWSRHPLSAAAGAVRELLADVGDAEQVVLCCDADGTLLWIEGDERALDAARTVHLQPGAVWSEAAAGTNAMGTALTVGHPLQVFSAEHFARPVAGWTCSAAPVRDPDTGEVAGVLDLSGAMATAHPHSLAVVTAAARMAEAELRRRSDLAAARLVDAHGRRVGRGRGQARALAGASGVVLLAAPDGLAGRRLAIPAEGGRVALPGGGAVVAEPLAETGGWLLWAPGRTGGRRAEPAVLRLEALGRERARLVADGAETVLSPRHGELLVLLALRPEGWTAEQLAIELLGDFGKPVTVRAELSRLRRLLGDRLTAQPYRVVGPLRTDVVEVQALLDAGRVRDALERYAGALLPASEVPAIAEARVRLDLGLRAAVLDAGDPDLLEPWLRSPSGRDDEHAARALLEQVSPADPRFAFALGRLERLAR